MESYDKAQDVQKVGHETKLDRLEPAQPKRPESAKVKTPA